MAWIYAMPGTDAPSPMMTIKIISKHCYRLLVVAGQLRVGEGKITLERTTPCFR